MQTVTISAESYEDIIEILNNIIKGSTADPIEVCREKTMAPCCSPCEDEEAGEDVSEETTKKAGLQNHFPLAYGAEADFAHTLESLGLEVVWQTWQPFSVEAKPSRELNTLEIQELTQAAWNFRAKVGRQYNGNYRFERVNAELL